MAIFNSFVKLPEGTQSSPSLHPSQMTPPPLAAAPGLRPRPPQFRSPRSSLRWANGWKGTKDVEKTWEKWWKVNENGWKIGWKMKVVWKSHEEIKYNQVKRRKTWWNMMKRMKNGNWNRLEHVESAESILQILQMLRPKRLEEMVWSNQRLKQRTVGCISKNGDLFFRFRGKNLDLDNRNDMLVGGAITILKNISQWEGLSHILWKIKNVWNHQPAWNEILGSPLQIPLNANRQV